ncbi:hypothetical protein DL546_003127 [Coniochaeta pulveracea]|uniref:Uncharacterized protein n=1 Tax=Coniochaeta pulveracea TaxID=177199 RepID=A0A420XYR3_9PEZI|nr:hypothetical protein DL546_003127 [Coniochaeta pulveracea]
MSFGFSIGDFLAIIEIARRIRKEFREAPTQLKNVADEVRNLSIALEDVEVFVSGDSESELSDQQKINLKELAASCRRVLHDLQQTLWKYKDLGTTGGNLGRRARRVWKRLEFEPDDVRELRHRLTSNVILLQAFLTQVTSHTTLDIKKGLDHLNLRADDEERLKVLTWLTPTDFAAQQSDYIGRRQPGTGQWLLDSPEFQTWMLADRQTLFCPGMPGAGKTILTSIVVDKLLGDFRDDKTIGIAYIYCNYRRTHEQQVCDLIASLVKQLSETQSTLPAGVQLLYDKHKDRRTRPTFDDLSKTLRSVVSAYSKVFVVVDALDECQMANGCRDRLVKEISDLASHSKTSFFATSRFIPKITERFTGTKTLEIQASANDVRRYVEGHISRLPSFVTRNPPLQGEVATGIIKAVDGMFLLAQLHLDSLVGMRSVKALKTALARLPSGSEAYDVSYQAAMERIQGQVAAQTKLAMEVLSWITIAKRPLTTTELQHALAVEVGQTQLDKDNIPELDDMVSVCAGLVTVDEQGGIIRLVHYTTEEYFKRKGAHWFPDAESNITTACITYMSSDNFSRGSCGYDEFEQRLRLNPLYRYATRHWGEHARRVSELGQEVVDFLLSKAKHVKASGQALIRALELEKGDWCDFSIADGLQLAAAIGCGEAVEALVQAGVELDSTEGHGRTPLSLAAGLGHAAIVRRLLETGRVNADSSDNHGQTPLSWAAKEGHEAVVRLLLAVETVDADSCDKDGQTPLSWASEYGHEDVVRRLLDTGQVVADSRNKYGTTPLLLAAVEGHGAVVELLLDTVKVDADSSVENFSTLLRLAAGDGHEAVVRLLLDTGTVNVDSRDRNGITALLWAAREAQETVFMLLLESGSADVVSHDNMKRTALSYAARNGYAKIATILLSNSSVNPDSKDLFGSTPLTIATRNHRTEVARQLMETGRVDLDSRDCFGRTPLWYARRYAYNDIADLLLQEAKKRVISLSRDDLAERGYSQPQGAPHHN